MEGDNNKKRCLIHQAYDFKDREHFRRKNPPTPRNRLQENIMTFLSETVEEALLCPLERKMNADCGLHF